VLEDKVVNEGIILSDAQVVALEKKKHVDEAYGEIETLHNQNPHHSPGCKTTKCSLF
jgi:hypothetical protein